jgi:hypothetical protein
MSVIVTLRGKGDASKLEEYAAADPDRIRGIMEAAQQHGVIAHRFYGTDDGQIMVLDEWPDAESFQAFFGATMDQIQPMMQSAGMTEEPEVSFWRKLDTQDDFGWGA